MEEKITKIAKKKNLFHIDFKELFEYKELLALYAKRDISVIYKQTILGPIWFLLQPLLMASVFSFVFGYIIKVSTDGMPRIVFYLSGLLVWNSFKAILDGVGQTFSSGKGVFAKIYFPRLIPAISQVISNSVFFMLNLVVFLIFYGYYIYQGVDLRPNIYVLCLPLIFIWIAISAFSFGLVVCSLTTKYRDLKFAMPFILQCWMYGSPIIFPIRGIENPIIQSIMLCNPVATAVEFVRYSFTGRGMVEPIAFVCSSSLVLVVLIIGILSFNKVQYNFVDTI